MAFAIAILFLFACYYLHFLWQKRVLIIKSWNHPGPFNLPIIGATYLFMCKSKNVINKFMAMQQRYPEGLKFWFGNHLVYSLHDPRQIEKVLGSSKFLQKDDVFYRYMVNALGEGLIQASVPVWKKHRKYIIPSFSQKNLDSFVEVFARQNLVLTDVLKSETAKEIDILKLTSRCTLDITCETALGLKLNNQRNDTDYARNFNRIYEMVILRGTHIWNHSNFVWKLLGHEKRLKFYKEKVNDLTDKMIKERMNAIRIKKNQESSVSEKDDKAFLDHIMESDALNSEELRDEVLIFLIAATDTTASAMTFAMAMLGMFPDIQQNVYDEVSSVLGNDRMPESSDLPRLVYTERFIKESLRLFPTAPFFFRSITEEIDMGKYVVPKGAAAYFGPLFIHRYEKYWPDPLKFDPDRFLPEEIAKRHPCTYIPFSYGPRNCIGKFFEMMELKVFIATVVRKFIVHCGYEKIEDIKLNADIVLRFQDGAKVSVTPRPK